MILPCIRKVESQGYFMESAKNLHIHPPIVNYIRSYSFFDWSSVIVPSALSFCIFRSLDWIWMWWPHESRAIWGRSRFSTSAISPLTLATLSSVLSLIPIVTSARIYPFCSNTLYTNQTLMLSTSFHKKAGDWPWISSGEILNWMQI